MPTSIEKLKSIAIKQPLVASSLPKELAIFIIQNLIHEVNFLRSNDNGTLYHTVPPTIRGHPHAFTYTEKIQQIEQFLSNFTTLTHSSDEQLDQFLFTINRSKLLSDPTHLNHQMLFKIVYYDAREKKQSENIQSISHGFTFYYDFLPHSLTITNLSNNQTERFELATSDELMIQNHIYLASFNQLIGEAITPRVLCGVGIDAELLQMLKPFPEFPFEKMSFLLNSGFIKPYLVIMEMPEKKDNKDDYLFKVTNTTNAVRSAKEFVRQEVQVVSMNETTLHIEPPILPIEPLRDLPQMLTMLHALHKMYEFGFVHGDFHVGNGFYSFSQNQLLNATLYGKSTIFDFSRCGLKTYELQAMWNKFRVNQYLNRPLDGSLGQENNTQLLEKPDILQDKEMLTNDDFIRSLIPFIHESNIKYYVQQFRLFSANQPIIHKHIKKYAEALRENAMVILFNFFPLLFTAPQQPSVQLDILSASYAWMVHLMQLFVTNNPILAEQLLEMEKSEEANMQAFYIQYNQQLELSNLRPLRGGGKKTKTLKPNSLTLQKKRPLLSLTKSISSETKTKTNTKLINKTLSLENIFEKYNNYVLDCNRLCIEI